MAGHRQFTHNNRPYTDQNYRDIVSQFIDTQDKFTDTLYKTQLQNSMSTYINDLRTCMSDNQEDFDPWLLSIEKVARLMDSDPNEICFAKAKGNLLTFLYSVKFKGCSWVISKRKCEQSSPRWQQPAMPLLHWCTANWKSEESLTAFIYRWSELLMQCCSIPPKHCRDKFK